MQVMQILGTVVTAIIVIILSILAYIKLFKKSESIQQKKYIQSYTFDEEEKKQFGTPDDEMPYDFTFTQWDPTGKNLNPKKLKLTVELYDDDKLELLKRIYVNFYGLGPPSRRDDFIEFVNVLKKDGVVPQDLFPKEIFGEHKSDMFSMQKLHYLMNIAKSTDEQKNHHSMDNLKIMYKYWHYLDYWNQWGFEGQNNVNYTDHFFHNSSKNLPEFDHEIALKVENYPIRTLRVNEMKKFFSEWKKRISDAEWLKKIFVESMNECQEMWNKHKSDDKPWWIRSFIYAEAWYLSELYQLMKQSFDVTACDEEMLKMFALLKKIEQTKIVNDEAFNKIYKELDTWKKIG